MHIGILGGTGPLGRGLALRLADAGHQVVVGSRDAGRAAAVVDELLGVWPTRQLQISGQANEETAEAEVVVMATPWEGADATVSALAPRLAGKVVVSVANALIKVGREMHPLVPPRGSVAAAVQAAAPGALVAAAGHHLPASGLAALDRTLQADVLVCSDHPEATATTMELFAGVAGLRPLDAGSLASAAAVEAFTAVLITINMRYRAHSTLRLGGLPAAQSAAPGAGR